MQASRSGELAQRHWTAARYHHERANLQQVSLLLDRRDGAGGERHQDSAGSQYGLRLRIAVAWGPLLRLPS